MPDLLPSRATSSSAVTTAVTSAAARAALRRRLLAQRQAMTATERAGCDRAIDDWLLALLGDAATGTLGFCWPHRGEYDGRGLVGRLVAQGLVAALPVVVARGQPLQFHRWSPGTPMVAGDHGIPVPAGTEPVRPALMLVPLLGFDERGYRLGYGGGYFDRTLAQPDRPWAIGVGYELSRLASIGPDAHDQPMDLIVTEAGIHRPGAGGLVAVTGAQARALLAAGRG